MQAEPSGENRDIEQPTATAFVNAIGQVKDYAIFMMDPHGRNISWNDGVQAVLGWNEASWLRTTIHDTFPAEDRDKADEELAQARKFGSANDDRWQVKRDGTRFLATGITTAVHEQSKLVGFVKILRDESYQRGRKPEHASFETAMASQLEAERALLAEVFRRSPSFMTVLRGPDHVYELANDRYYELVGERKLIGRSVREVFPELAGQGYFELLDRVFQTGVPFVGRNMHARVQRAPGEPLTDISIDLVYQPLRGPSDEITGIFAHGVDLSERHRAELHLQASEARFHFLSDLAEATRDSTDPEEVMAIAARMLGEHLQASRCAYADVAADSNRFEIRHDYRVEGLPSSVGQYKLDAFGSIAAKAQRTGQTLVVHDVEQELAPADGAAMFTSIGIKAVICCPLVRAGRLVAMMAVHQAQPRKWTPEEVSLIEAVVERSWAYIERARIMRELTEEEAKFRQLADAMPQIVFAARPDGHVDYFNRKWYEYTGLTNDGSTGDESWIDVHEPDALDRVRKTWLKSLQTGEPYEIEYRLRRSDGVFRWHLARALPIRNDAGQIIRWFGTNTDIHDHRLLLEENQLLLTSERAARAEAERISRMKDEFLATLSHELRTPLSAILGWAHLLRRADVSQQDTEQGLETIERNAQAQAQLIDDLLDMSRIISGNIRLEVQPISVSAAVQAAIDTVQHAAAAKRIALLRSIQSPIPSIAGDPHRIQQIVWNLLSNSIKFTPVEGQIEVVVKHGEGEVAISVSDTGVGIKPDFLPFVFERFRQADASTTRRFGGLGLGLAIVKQLVELHGGSVSVFSRGEGRGTTFTVRLPVTLPTAKDVVAAELRQELEAVSPAQWQLPSLSGIHVLVVDDDRDTREFVRRILAEAGASVLLASSASQALWFLREAPPDIMVSDIGMPEVDGYTLMREARAMGCNIPCAALTAFARSEDRTRALMAGFQTHISKPVDVNELVATVASLSGRTG